MHDTPSAWLCMKHADALTYLGCVRPEEITLYRPLLIDSGALGNFSHVQTQSPKQERKPKSHRRRPTPTFQKMSFAKEMENITAEQIGVMPLRNLATNHDGPTFASVARAAELHASRINKAERLRADGRVLNSTTADQSGEGTALSSYLVFKPRPKALKAAIIAPSASEEYPTAIPNSPSSPTQAGRSSTSSHQQQPGADFDRESHTQAGQSSTSLHQQQSSSHADREHPLSRSVGLSHGQAHQPFTSLHQQPSGSEPIQESVTKAGQSSTSIHQQPSGSESIQASVTKAGQSSVSPRQHQSGSHSDQEDPLISSVGLSRTQSGQSFTSLHQPQSGCDSIQKSPLSRHVNSSLTQAGQPCTTSHQQQSGSDSEQHGPSRRRFKRSLITRALDRRLEAFPLRSPIDSPSLNLSHAKVTTSPTHFAEVEHNVWQSLNSNELNVGHPTNMPRGGKKGVSPSTPGSEGGKSHQNTSHPSSSSNAKKGNPFREYPPTGQMSSIAGSSLNPNQPAFQSRLTPEHSRRTMRGDTPSRQGGIESQRSTQQAVMDDPFSEQSHSTSSTRHNYGNMNAAYSPHFDQRQSEYGQQIVPPGYFHHSPYGQQSPYPHQPAYMQHSSHSQQPPLYRQSSYAYQTSDARRSSLLPLQASYAEQSPHIQRSPFTQRSPYAQHQAFDQLPEYDQSDHGRTALAFAQSFQHGGQNMTNQQQAFAQPPMSNPIAAMRMPPPPPVKEKPTYDPRLMAAALQSLPDDIERQMVRDSDPQDQQAFLDDFLTRHPEAYTMQQSVDTPKQPTHQTSATLEESGGPSKQPSQDLTAHTNAPHDGKGPAMALPQKREPAPYRGVATSNSKVEMLLKNLEKVVETSTAQGEPSRAARTVLHDPLAHASAKTPSSADTTSTVKAPASSSKQPSAQSQQFAPHTHQAPLTRDPNDFSSGIYSSEHQHGYDGPSRPTTRLPDPSRHTQEDTATATVHNPYDKILNFTEDGKGPFKKQSRFFPPQEEILYTATRHPIPHGGFTDFTTPYNVDFFGNPKDFHPANDAGRAEGNFFLQRAITQDLPKTNEAKLHEGVRWFHTEPRHHELVAVAMEVDARSEKPLPKPIGHERASASGSSGKRSSTSTTSPKRDLMKNPSATDAKDLMVSTLANLAGYASGAQVGDLFAHWARPGEWAVDKSRDGNKSFFGGGFEAAPLRVARDPRYQQTMTLDGRSTYFEDPSRGKHRGWGMK